MSARESPSTVKMRKFSLAKLKCYTVLDTTGLAIQASGCPLKFAEAVWGSAIQLEQVGKYQPYPDRLFNLQFHIFQVYSVCLVPHFSAVSRVYVNKNKWVVGLRPTDIHIIHDVS